MTVSSTARRHGAGSSDDEDEDTPLFSIKNTLGETGQGTNTSAEAAAKAARSAKRPRIRLASSAVQEAYDAAAAIKRRLGAGDEGSDDEDVPLFSIKNIEKAKKTASRTEVLSQLHVGCAITVKDGPFSKNGWPGRVVDMAKNRVLVHFLGWNTRYDRWLPAKWSRIALSTKKPAPGHPQRARTSRIDARAQEGGPDGRVPAPHRVSWLDSAAPAKDIRLRTATGYMPPRACYPRMLAPAGKTAAHQGKTGFLALKQCLSSGLRYDLLSGSSKAHIGAVGLGLLERWISRHHSAGRPERLCTDGMIDLKQLPCRRYRYRSIAELVVVSPRQE